MLHFSYLLTICQPLYALADRKIKELTCEHPSALFLEPDAHHVLADTLIVDDRGPLVAAHLEHPDVLVPACSQELDGKRTESLEDYLNMSRLVQLKL